MANLSSAPAAKNDIKQVLKNIKSVARYRDSRTAKSKKQGRDDHMKQLSIQTPSYLFRYMHIMEKDPCRGVVALTILCDHPYLVSIFFAILLSLHLVAFLTFLQLYTLTPG